MTRSYMFNERNLGSQRREREEKQVELRRQRTDELLNKKRAPGESSEATAEFVQLKAQIETDNIEKLYHVVHTCRTSLSIETNPPIQGIIDSGIVPRIVELMDAQSFNKFRNAFPEKDIEGLIPRIRAEAAWVITNIASGTTEQTAFLVRENAVEVLIKMITEDDDMIVDQAIWALGNIAGDSEEMRNEVLNRGFLDSAEGLLERYSNSADNVKILRNIVWLLSNLSRGKNPRPKEEHIAFIFRVMEKLIMMNDGAIVRDAFWTFSYIVDSNNEYTDRVLSSPVMVRCYNLLNNLVASLQKKETVKISGITSSNDGSYDLVLSKVAATAICPIIRLIGNIISGTDAATDMIISTGILSFFKVIFYYFENKKQSRIRKEICWICSNIAAGTPEQIKSLIKSDIIEMLIDAMDRYELFVRKEACFAILNVLFFVSKNSEFLQDLTNKHLLETLGEYLKAVNNMPEMQMHVLDCFKYALEAGNEIRLKYGTNPVVSTLLDTKTVDVIEELQDSNNHLLVRKAYNIIVDYFDGEME
ncbi:importin subunit alpha-6/7 [Enteropsectra breve]|nr:importin subunit alpha-6/7 [Enteropsectra breve]